MKMNRFSILLTLACIGIALMLAGNASAQRVSIEAEITTGIVDIDSRIYKIGEEASLTITLRNNGTVAPDEGVEFKVLGIVDNQEVVIENDPNAATLDTVSGTTDRTGKVTTGVTFKRAGRIGIQVIVSEFNFRSVIAFRVEQPEDLTTRIVATPTVEGPLAVGDTFTYSIEIENVKDLAAYSIDVAFNSNVLEVVEITEGDFLESGGLDAFFYDNAKGTIQLSQTRINRTYDATTGNAVLASIAKGGGVDNGGTLATIEFKLKEFAEEALGLHNIQLSDSEGARVSYLAEIHPVVATHMFPAEDVNRDGIVNVLDLTAVAGSLGKANPINPRADVNDDGIVNALDLVTVAKSLGKSTPAAKVRNPNTLPAAPAANVANLSPETIQGWIDIAQVEDDGSAIFDLGIANLERLLQATVPEATKLLLNYPNPFNPETWIPYQLATATDVTVSIYSVNGTLVRTLALGHQAAGVYQSKSQAAYWDGRNELGEQVASGVYFYTLTAGGFSATGKMLVRK